MSMTDEAIVPDQTAAPPVPFHEMPEEAKRQLMKLVKLLVTDYDRHCPTNRGSNARLRPAGFDPRKGFTLTGIILEADEVGDPVALWTPLGRFVFAVGALKKDDLEGFLARLDLREHYVHGRRRGLQSPPLTPLRAVLAVNGQPLPEPVVPGDRGGRQDAGYYRKEWERLFAAE